MEVCRQEFTEGILERIRLKVETEHDLSRFSLSRQVCEWLDWRRPDGTLKDMSCRVALLRMHRKGIIPLPEPRSEPVMALRKMGETKLPMDAEEPIPICCELSELGKVEVVQVGSRYSKASHQWKILMNNYHYLGAGPLCGAQLRYLIRSPHHGWLGALSFSAAAWKVKSRDEWIGWDDKNRQDNLCRVVNNSRFLILPHVKVPNLASHVLSLCTQRLSGDWLERYGIEPVLLETFVEQQRFHGTSYRAANWVFAGSTCGRGRQDRENRAALPVKDVYLYPLHRRARPMLCEGMETVSKDKEKPKINKLPEDWAEEEFGGAELGDSRLQKRLLTIARDLYARPQANIPQACGSKARTKAAYRFFDHDRTAMEKILKPHYESTVRRVREHRVVLAVQDTTTLNYSKHPATEGLGTIGSTLDKSVGLILHNTMAVSQEGTPLGLLDVQCWVRNKEDFGKKCRRHELPIEQKESYKWLKSFHAVEGAQKDCENSMIVSVGDREADIYELFELALEGTTGAKLLVRAERERLLADGQGHLWEKVAQVRVSGIQILRVPRRGNRMAREAEMEIRFAEVTLIPPKTKPHLNKIKLWAVLAQEIGEPEGVEPLRWMLLSTVDVSTFEQATERLAWYALRWGIEVYHKTLKSGCKIEDRQLSAADSIEACLSIDMVVAWRIFHLTKLGRETPDVPCTVFFEDEEWKALNTYKTQNPVPPENPPTLREAMRMTATLGGFLGRKSDGEPGTQTLWLGLQRLDDLTTMWKHMAAHYAPHLLKPTVSSNRTYG